MKKSVLLSCPTLKRELLQAARENGFSYPIYFLPSQLHSSPENLREYLQQRIDALEDVEQILLCVSGCGGGTVGLKATSGNLILPKTRDCLDILLSQKGLADIQRPQNAIFITEDWAEFMNGLKARFEAQAQEKGEAYAIEAIRLMFQGFEDFYMIDTGVYDIGKVEEDIRPLVKIVKGWMHKVTGGYGILRKMTAGKFDQDCIIVKKGEEVRKADFALENPVC